MRLGQLWARLEPVRRRIRARFAVDTRSLAAVRIVLGLTLLGDLIYRAGSMALFYSDGGVYPLSAYEVTWGFYNLSLHALSGELWFLQFMFLLAGLFALAFTLGYRTRLVGFVSLVLLFSLHARNPGVLNGGDRLLRVILLVALVAPLGERWSIDALRRGTARATVASFGTAALLVQPLVVFATNALLKHDGELWYAGEALNVAFHNDVMTILLGNVVVDYPTLLMVLNYAWVILLSGSVLFLLVPVGRLRSLTALAYIGAFAGMLVTMSVGVFPLALIASVLAYLTAPFWDSLSRVVPPHWVDRLPTGGALGPFSRPPIERRALDSLRERGHEFAASYVVSYAQSLLTVLGVLLLIWMLIFAAEDVSEFSVPAEIDYTHVDQQSWGLYAPDPGDSYSWYVVEAQLENETVIADLGGTADTFEHPPDASQSYDTFRHRKYMQKVRKSTEDDTTDRVVEAYADWACREVSATRGQSVETITINRIYQQSPIDGERDDPRTISIFEQDCTAG